MNIKRIDSYTDNRFSKAALNQHGAYLIDNEPYQIVITDSSSAVIYGKNPAVYKTLIEEFRFHAPHIFKFYDTSARLIAEYPVPPFLMCRSKTFSRLSFMSAKKYLDPEGHDPAAA